MSKKMILASVAPLARRDTRLQWENTSPVGKFVSFSVVAGFIVAGFTWASSQFSQIRGVQHMLTSRIFLVLTLVFALAGTWLLAWVFFYSKRYIISIVVAVLLMVAGFALDREFPTLDQSRSFPAPTRAHLQVEEVSVEVESPGPYWSNIWAHIRGYNRSTIPTSGNVQILAGVKVSPFLPSAKAEEEQLFEDKSLWVNEGFFKGDSIYPQEPFQINKRENLTILDNERDPQATFSAQTQRELKEGKLLVYVVTRAIYHDQYGPLPEDRSCSAFKYNPDSGRFESPGNCLLYIQHNFGKR